MWISPDQCNDMHGLSSDNATAVGIPDCASPASGLDHAVITRGDNFLGATVPMIMSSSAWTPTCTLAALPAVPLPSASTSGFLTHWTAYLYHAVMMGGRWPLFQRAVKRIGDGSIP